jgi:hypothetical protein
MWKSAAYEQWPSEDSMTATRLKRKTTKIVSGDGMVSVLFLVGYLRPSYPRGSGIHLPS